MSLFDEFERAETRPRRQNEGEFVYMNSSARPGFGMIRELLERWFDQLPRAAQAYIRARFRSCDKAQHQSAFFELYWHELLRVSGNDIEIHPVLPDAATNPDFLVLRNHTPQFYFEVTLAMPPEDLAANRRFAEFHDTLDRMESPDFFLEVEFRGSPIGNLRGRVIRERLERWVRSLNHAEIAQMYQDQTYDSVPSLTWSEQGGTLTCSPIPKCPQFRWQPGARPVGLVMPAEMRDLHTHDDIRAAIDGKGSKYGNLGLPLVVAVNVLDDFCDDDDIWNALFGEEQITVTREPGGDFRHDWGPRAFQTVPGEDEMEPGIDL
jgi:hypothetical protein